MSMNKQPDVEVASILTMVRLCEKYGVLPSPGGLLDQDSYHVWLMEQVAIFDHKKEEREKAKQKIPT